MEASLPIVIGIVVPIIGTVIAGVVALGIMAWRIMGRLDRRIDNDKAATDADRRAADAIKAAPFKPVSIPRWIPSGPKCADSPNGNRTSKAGSTNAVPPPTENRFRFHRRRTGRHQARTTGLPAGEEPAGLPAEVPNGPARTHRPDP